MEKQAQGLPVGKADVGAGREPGFYPGSATPAPWSLAGSREEEPLPGGIFAGEPRAQNFSWTVWAATSCPELLRSP